jgi:hypothetical protein
LHALQRALKRQNEQLEETVAAPGQPVLSGPLKRESTRRFVGPPEFTIPTGTFESVTILLDVSPDWSDECDDRKRLPVKEKCHGEIHNRLGQ